MPSLSEIGNSLLTIGSPIAWHKLADLSQFMGLGPDKRVLDLGAGKGEILLRLAETYAVTGVALEIRENFCQHLRETIAQRGVKGIEVACADARQWLTSQPAHAFDAIVCLGSSGALGGYRPCLEQLGHWLAPGGSLLIGEGYWQREPDPAYLAETGIPRSEMSSHADNVALARELGWDYLMAYTASPEEWDSFEGRYHLAVREYLRAHPDDPAVASLDQAITRWHGAYLRYGRETLGFGSYLLRKGITA